MALQDNNPQYRWVSWKNLLVTYENVTYQIQNSETNMKYIYWDITNPYVLQCFDRTQTQKPGFYQVFINERGIGTERSHEDLILSWDGNNIDLITKQIYGLHEENKENGNRFMYIEQDIDQIKNTVGTSTEDEGSLLQEVSQIKQKSNEIGLSVDKLEQTFSDDREITELRENLNKSMIDYNSSLGIFKSEIYTYYKDNKIIEEEKIKIDTQLDIMDNKRSEVIKYVDVIIVLMEGKGQTTEVSKLNSAKTKFINSVDNLRRYITTAISDGTTVPSEIVGIVDLFAKCNTAINDMKNACDDAIYLGAGGRISEELARIGIKSDEIVLSVSKNEEDIRNNLSVEKGLLQGNITDLRGALDDLHKNLKNAYKDGIISVEEKEIIDSRITKLTKEKLDIDVKYNDLYNDRYISESIKEELKSTYTKFNNKFTETTEKIKEVISDNYVNDAEKNQVDTVINELLSEITILHAVMVKSSDDIQLNMNKAEIKAAKDEVQGNINDVNNKVEDLGEYVNGTFENNILDETERKNIKSNLDSLAREKVDIDSQYTQLSANKYLDGILKTNYSTSYNNFLSKYNDLINILNGILEKTDLINNSDRDNMNGAYAQLNEVIGVFIRLSNEVLEYISKKEAEFVKNTLGKDINDVDRKIDDLNNDINGVFKNSIIDESERNAIALNLKDLETQKIDVDAQYNQFILSTHLDGVLKTELETRYNESISKYNALVGVMEGILNKQELINDTDRKNLNDAKDAYNITIGEFSRTANKVIEYIGKKQSEGAVGDFSKQLEDLNKKVDGILDDVSGAIADDIIDETERIAIKQSLKNLENDFISNESEYLKVYNNPNLVGTVKTELNTVFNTYLSKYNNLVNVINSLLNKSGNIDDIDRRNLDNAYTEYGNSTKLYLSKFYEAMDSITNKGIEDAKNELNKELSDLTQSLTDLEGTMNGVFKDGVLSEAKKESIKQNLQTLAAEKADIDKSYSITYNNVNLIGTPKLDLKNSYDLYTSEYNNLVKVINEILNKIGILDSTDQAKLDTAFLKHRTSLGTFKEKYNIAIDSITNKSVSDAKNAIQKEISDLNGALGDLEDVMNNAFKDGVLSDAEKLAMKQQLQVVESDKVKVDNQYDGLYKNPDLIGDASTNLKSSYDIYILKYNNLVSVINDILNKVGLIDSTDQNNLNNAMSQYRSSIGEYSKRANDAIDSIARKKANDAEKNAKSHTEAQIKLVNDAINLKVSQVTYDKNNQVIDDRFSEVNQTAENISQTVSKKVGKEEVVSSINQSAEKIKIKANKIDIEGSTTIGDGKGNYVGIDGYNYSAYTNYIKTMYFGGWLEDGIYVPTVYMGSSGFDSNSSGASGTYFAMKAYSNYHHLGYRSRTTGKWSILQFHEAGDITFIPHVKCTFDRPSVFRQGIEIRDEYDIKMYDWNGNVKGRISRGVFELSQIKSIDNTLIQVKDSVRCMTWGNSMGTADGRWGTIYLSQAPDVSSDITLKENIVYTDEKSTIPYMVNIIEDDSLTYRDMYEFYRDIYRSAEYNYLDDDKKVLGIIAQDIVNTKVGNKIIRHNTDGKLSYSLETRVTVAEGALKEAINEIESLKEDRDLWKNEYKNLENKVNLLIKDFEEFKTK
ncbi:hypothetical protein UT300012_32130 [Paraclostridium bifermentans]